MAAKHARPPLPNLTDPIQRAFARQQGDAKLLAAAYQALLAGQVSLFPFVADWVLAGTSLPAASAPDTPCARFFRELFEQAPKTERDAFLRLALHGQLGSPAIIERSPRVLLQAPPAVADRILRYLAGFESPQRPSDDQGLIGEVLRTFSTYPHPTMVRIAGDLGLRAALPQLERFLALKRRFYLLHTDYTTHPEEVDALFMESLRAVVSIAAQSREAHTEAKALLSRLRKQSEAEQSSDPLMGSGEPIALEELYDREGRSSRSQVRQTVLRAQDGVRSKVDWLQLALRALDGDVAKAALLHRSGRAPAQPPLSIPGAAWTVDCDEPRAALAGDRLYLLTRIFVQKQHRAVLWALDAATGQTRFIAPLGLPGQPNNSRELHPRSLHLDPDGSIVLLGPIEEGSQRRSYLFRFSAESGEVSAILPVPTSGDSDPELIAADADGYVLRHGSQLVRISPQGALRFRWPLSEDTRVLSADGQVLALSADHVQLARAGATDGKPPSRWAIATLLGQPAVDAGAFPLLLPDGFAIADPSRRQLACFDWQGSPRARTPIPEGAAPFHEAQGPLASRALLARNKLLVVPSITAPPIVLPASLNLSKLWVSETAAYLLDERALIEQPLSGGPKRRLPDLGSAHMASVVAASREWLIVAAYQDGYHVGALRPSK